MRGPDNRAIREKARALIRALIRALHTILKRFNKATIACSLRDPGIANCEITCRQFDGFQEVLIIITISAVSKDLEWQKIIQNTGTCQEGYCCAHVDVVAQKEDWEALSR